jgi:energy-coupling factor transport system substrate-specific component
VTAVAPGRRAALLLGLTTAVGLVAFSWPLLVPPPGGSVDLAHLSDAPWIFLVLVPLLLGVVVAELADGGMDSRAVALLGVLAACGSALRLAGAGVTGFEAVFFLLIPAGRVLGRRFGFVLGAVTLVASALLTGGVGPWLPFQMLAAAWIGFGAGCLPRARGRAEVALLAGYGVVAGLAYGLVLDLWFWPFALDDGSALAFVPGASVATNLSRFWAFHLATSLGWDLPRAATNALLMVVAGPAVLAALRRASRRASFGVPVVFGPSAAVDASPGAGTGT